MQRGKEGEEAFSAEMMKAQLYARARVWELFRLEHGFPAEVLLGQDTAVLRQRPALHLLKPFGAAGVHHVCPQPLSIPFTASQTLPTPEAVTPHTSPELPFDKRSWGKQTGAGKSRGWKRKWRL